MEEKFKSKQSTKKTVRSNERKTLQKYLHLYVLLNLSFDKNVTPMSIAKATNPVAIPIKLNIIQSFKFR